MSMLCAFSKNLLLKKVQSVAALALISGLPILTACADATVPDARNVNIPAPVTAEQRQRAVNERPDSVMYLPLGEDVLVPSAIAGVGLPKDRVGPFELRGETLAGALQLILADYDVSIAFETQQGLSRRITVANLKGSLDGVVQRVCSLADLYCAFEDETIIVKDTQVFAVTIPPVGTEGDTAFLDDVITGLTAIVGEDVEAPVSDPTTRTIIYTATQRSAKLAENYFQRLRANTALVVFETYIWEVSLNAGNSMGVDWAEFGSLGKFNTGVTVSGNIGADFTNPVNIGLPTTGALSGDVEPSKFIEFLSRFGAVKTISQPQISVLSGSEAELRVADTENYVSEITTTLSEGQSTTSVSTDSVDSGFTLGIGSSWDKSTVYADVSIALENVNSIEDFTFSDGGDSGTSTTIQLPQTSERELNTQIRVRPGDSILIAGLVRENDDFNSRGPGFMEPLLPDSRTAQTQNLELVFMMRPRVIVYTNGEDQRRKNFEDAKRTSQERAETKARNDWIKASQQREMEMKRQAEELRAPVMREEVQSPIAPAPIFVQPEPAPTQSVILEPVMRAPARPEPIVQAAPAPVPAQIVPDVIPQMVEPVIVQPEIVQPEVIVEPSYELFNSAPSVAPVTQDAPKQQMYFEAPRMVEPEIVEPIVQPIAEPVMEKVIEDVIEQTPEVVPAPSSKLLNVPATSPVSSSLEGMGETYTPSSAQTRGRYSKSVRDEAYYSTDFGG